MLKRTGKTEDGKDVIGGMYQFIETHGLPLDILVAQIDAKGAVPNWVDFLDSSVEAGSKWERAVLKLSTAVKDCYGPKYFEEWERKLKEYETRTSKRG